MRALAAAEDKIVNTLEAFLRRADFGIRSWDTTEDEVVPESKRKVAKAIPHPQAYVLPLYAFPPMHQNRKGEAKEYRVTSR